MMRRGLLIGIFFGCVLSAVLLISSCEILTEEEFNEIKNCVERESVRISIDLVDGNYVVEFDEAVANDETVERVLPHLKKLPTGFTLVGVGEGRQYWIAIANSRITSEGFRKLLKLPVEWLEIQGGELSDSVIDELDGCPNLRGLILTDVKHTQVAIDNFIKNNPRILVDIKSGVASQNAN